MSNSNERRVKCRACGRDVIVEIDAECPEDWAAQLLAAITCERCYTLKTRRDGAEDSIRTACVNLDMISRVRKPTVQELANTRQGLIAATRAYTRFLADFRCNPNIIWNAQIVDDLLLKPAEWYRTLKAYRLATRTAPKPPPKPDTEVMI